MVFTYILRCADNTLYVGHTEDLASREQIHNEGRGAKYTAALRPVRMVYAEEHPSAISAIARERQLKRWSGNKKEALILGDRPALRLLGRRPTKSNAVVTWRDLLNRGS
jgi:predicted GIY-YIG superfamily endonuclease